LFYLRSPVRFEGGCATSASDADDTCVIQRLAEGRFACALDLECGARYAPVSEWRARRRRLP
jgi:hypothetical protein